MIHYLFFLAICFLIGFFMGRFNDFSIYSIIITTIIVLCWGYIWTRWLKPKKEE